MIICMPERLQSVDACLTAHGFDLADLRARGQHVSLDAAQTLDRFMVSGRPDRRRFGDVVGGQLLGDTCAYSLDVL